MKKISMIIIIACMVFTLAGCGDHTHEFGDWSNTKEPTCTENGVRTKTCSECGETEDEDVPALGHNFVNGSCTECGAEE